MSHPRALLLGSGLVSKPLIRYLLINEIKLTVVTPLLDKAVSLINGHPLGTARYWTSDDRSELDRLISTHDLAISLLPAPMHPMVARRCLVHGKPMVTTSYVSPEMRGLKSKAKEAGVVFLNEVGVDPGIDHMSAMRVINRVKGQGGRVTSFRSYCGGLPAPASNDNPWGYKFSWSPLGVLRAGTSSARYRKAGELLNLSPEHLFLDTHGLHFDGVGDLEAYPNRDSIKYGELYGLPNATSMFRGTLRYPGWCKTMRRVGELGLLNLSSRHDLHELTWSQLMAELVGCPEENLKDRVASHLWLMPEDPTMQKLEWLGVFSDTPVDETSTSVAEALSNLMQSRMTYGDSDQDMIVMHHAFVADYDDRLERITSTMITHGVPGGDSSMARTVGLPAAIASRLLLQGRLKLPGGVYRPLTPDIYNPILDELEVQGIGLKEEIFEM